MTKKILSIIFSLVFISGLAFSITWGVINFNKVKTGMANTGVYTNEDLNKSYEDGYSNALKDKAEYTALIAEYRDTITSLNDKISQLNFQITTLTSNNQACNSQIENLVNQKQSLESQVSNLQTVKNENDLTIKNLDNQITELQSTVSQLETNQSQNQNTINELNTQIGNLQSINVQLQTTNQINADTITSLNSQIITLNTQIQEMSSLSQNATSQITALNNRVNELQASVSYYENFIATMENTEQVVATYEVDGSVWKIEVVNKGSEITLTQPADTETLIINGWKVNGEGSLLGDTYKMDTNTKFVADVIRKYPVQFMSDNQLYENQYVVENEFATLPTPPYKDGYDFLGWSLNGVDVIDNINSINVTETTTYYAVYIKVHTVTFMLDEQIVNVQNIRNGECATIPTDQTKTDHIFLGWSINGSDIINEIDVTPVTADTIYLATFEKLCTVTFMQDNQVIAVQKIRKGNYADDSSVIVETEDTFEGWQIDDAMIDVASYQIFGDTIFVAKINIDNWRSMTWTGIDSKVSISRNNIWAYGGNYYYSSYYRSYGNNFYLHYILNVETQTWEEITWNGFRSFAGYEIVVIGDVCYYYNYNGNLEPIFYQLDLATSTWTKVTKTKDEIWLYNGNGHLSQNVIWTDGIDYYISGSTDVNWTEFKHWKYNFSTNTFEVITWNFDLFSGYDIWTDGVNYYCSTQKHGHYVLDVATHTWSPMTWNGLTEFIGSYIWTDGKNYYYSQDDKQYILEVATHTWHAVTWYGIDPFYGGRNIWTDGVNYYHGFNYVLFKSPTLDLES